MVIILTMNTTDIFIEYTETMWTNARERVNRMTQEKKSRGKRKPVDIDSDELGNIMGSATGESEYSNVSGGWAGTDDDASSAPSDQIGNPPIREEDKPITIINRDMNSALQRDDDEDLPFRAETD
jgi:hypothetical protein